MTKQEVLEVLRESPIDFPEDAVKEVLANKDDYTDELIESLIYAFNNAKELHDNESDYCMHIYAMFLLAEFREKRAFPHLIALLRLPPGMVDFLLRSILTDDFDRILFSTFDPKQLQLLYDVIEDVKLFEWARQSALSALEIICRHGLIERDEYVSYMRGLIYEKLPADDTDIMFTIIMDCVVNGNITEMKDDIKYLFDNDRIDELYVGDYDEFTEMLDDDDQRELKSYIENALDELSQYIGDDYDDDEFEFPEIDSGNDYDKFENDYDKDDQISTEAFNEYKNIGRNDPCPCGSGKKYKKCCLSLNERS